MIMVRRTERKWKKYLGSRHWGGGNAKNRRGKGSRGGKGYAGSHKHKWLKMITQEPDHFSEKGFASIPKRYNDRKKMEIVNVGDIYSMASAGKLQKKEGLFQFEFGGKVLGSGTIALPVSVKASSVSESAKTKIEAAGGKVATTKAVQTQAEN